MKTIKRILLRTISICLGFAVLLYFAAASFGCFIMMYHDEWTWWQLLLVHIPLALIIASMNEIGKIIKKIAEY